MRILLKKCQFLPGATAEDLPKVLMATDFKDINTCGTHLDAPFHYHPTMNNGERAWIIDECL